MAHFENNGSQRIISIQTINNKAELTDYCERVFNNLVDNKNWNKKIMVDCLADVKMPFTLVPEEHHIDRSFRDTYYMYFSNQHFKVRRYSTRLSIFRGTVRLSDLIGGNTESIQKKFIGAMVINPLLTAPIGFTLISPKYLLEKKASNPIYMRLSTFKMHIYGKELLIRAFPYRMQDQETMRCGEVTILNILEYFSNTYHDYRMVVPSDIINAELKHSHERVLPSNGTTYTILTKVLADFGFSPRLYNRSILSENGLSYSSQEMMKRILFCYIESGFPIAVNLIPVNGVGAGHSIVCIGHEEVNNDLWESAIKQKIIPFKKRETGHALINSADLVENFVVIDDNSPIYSIRKFDQLSVAGNIMKVENIAVPLYKRMFLDAVNAMEVFHTVLQDDRLGLDKWGKDILTKNEDVVIRVFMASSVSFKKFRTAKQKPQAAYVYAKVQMPRFIWICELYQADKYKNKETRLAFGEIIVDATSAPNRQDRSLILMRYGGKITFRTPGQMKSGFKKWVIIPDEEQIVPYSENLDIVNV